MTSPSPLLSVGDYERAAAGAMSAHARAFVDGGAADERTLADNPRAWDRIALRPRVLTGVTDPDLSVELLGRLRAHPIVAAPVAGATLTHPDGPRGLARAAARTDTVMCVSTLAGVSTTELAREEPGAPRWFQLYVLRDRGATAELVAAAERDGCEAIVVTADRPVLGTRDRERRALLRDAPASGAADAIPGDTGALIDPAIAWSDVASLAAGGALPVIVKGVLTAEDARRAADHGAAGVVVSNHGGRQLDTAVTGADALPGIVEAVGDRIDVLVDGGVRRGTDVVKALALGARGVMVGRPLLWGLAIDGASGAQRVIEILLTELRDALVLCGAGAASAVEPGLVTAAARAVP